MIYEVADTDNIADEMIRNLAAFAQLPAMPNVNVVDEMVNMISASRAYQNNVDTMNAAKSMLLKTLSIGQG